MTPAQSQQKALNGLETLGGKPVVLREELSLPNPAKIHIASGTEPFHVLTYSRAAGQELPYFVCFQCGLAERALRAAHDERFNVANTSTTYKQVETLVRAKKSLPEDMISTYSKMIADGLGTQLRSTPIGIRIDRAIHEMHPELREMQRRAADRSMKENVGCLHPSVRRIAPDLVVKASGGMNAAFALAWSRLWGEDAHVVPYRLAGFLETGRRLMDVLDSTPDSPTHDRELVSTWASMLGIDHLYEVGPVGL
jgi:hypothetical protein